MDAVACGRLEVFVEVCAESKKKGGVGIRTGMWDEDVRVAFVVDRVWVCDGEEARVDVEGGVFFDGDGLAG